MSSTAIHMKGNGKEMNQTQTCDLELIRGALADAHTKNARLEGALRLILEAVTGYRTPECFTMQPELAVLMVRERLAGRHSEMIQRLTAMVNSKGKA